MAYDVTTLTIKGTELLASATAANNLVVAGCDATQTFVPKASAVTVQNRPANPYSNTTSVRLEGATENHVFIRIFFKEGESTGGDVNTLYLYGHSASDPTHDYVIAVMSSQTPFHLPEDGDISNVYGTLLDIIYNVADGSVSTVTASVYATYSEYADLRDRAVTTHKMGQPIVGDNQTIYGNKTFIDPANFNTANINTANIDTGNIDLIKMGAMQAARTRSYPSNRDIGVIENFLNENDNIVLTNTYYVEGNSGYCTMEVKNLSGTPSSGGALFNISHSNSYNSAENSASLKICGSTSNTWHGFSVEYKNSESKNVATIFGEKVLVKGPSKFTDTITVDPGGGNPCVLREATNIAPNNFSYKTGSIGINTITHPDSSTTSYVAADLVSLETQEVTYKLEATAGTTTESIDSFGLNCFSIVQSEQQGTVTNQYSSAFLYSDKKEFVLPGGGTEERRVGRVEIIANEPRNNQSAKLELLTDYDSSDNAFTSTKLSASYVQIISTSGIKFNLQNNVGILDLSIYPGSVNGTEKFIIYPTSYTTLPVDIGSNLSPFDCVYANSFIGTATKATNDINNNAITSYYRSASTSGSSIDLTKGNSTGDSVILNPCVAMASQGKEVAIDTVYSRVGGIGLFLYTGSVTSKAPGDTVSGSDLKPASIMKEYSSGDFKIISNGSVSGTWTLLSYFSTSNAGDAALVLAVKTSTT